MPKYRRFQLLEDDPVASEEVTPEEVASVNGIDVIADEEDRNNYTELNLNFSMDSFRLAWGSAKDRPTKIALIKLIFQKQFNMDINRVLDLSDEQNVDIWDFIFDDFGFIENNEMLVYLVKMNQWIQNPMNLEQLTMLYNLYRSDTISKEDLAYRGQFGINHIIFNTDLVNYKDSDYTFFVQTFRFLSSGGYKSYVKGRYNINITNTNAVVGEDGNKSEQEVDTVIRFHHRPQKDGEEPDKYKEYKQNNPIDTPLQVMLKIVFVNGNKLQKGSGDSWHLQKLRDPDAIDNILQEMAKPQNNSQGWLDNEDSGSGRAKDLTGTKEGEKKGQTVTVEIAKKINDYDAMKTIKEQSGIKTASEAKQFMSYLYELISKNALTDGDE